MDTILSSDLTWHYAEDSEEKIRNKKLYDTLLKIRRAQFEIITQEIETGREPTWEDFVRSHDLVIILGFTQDYESAQEIVKWQIQNAEAGKWTAYLEPIQRSLKCLRNNDYLCYDIFTVTKPDFPEKNRFSRRLFSFKGPRARVCVPHHVLDPDPHWYGDY